MFHLFGDNWSSDNDSVWAECDYHVCFLSLLLRLFLLVSSLNHQINFVKDQQDDITAKLQAEYLTLEEEISALGLEVSFSLLSHQFSFMYSLSVTLRQTCHYVKDVLMLFKDGHVVLCRNILLLRICWWTQTAFQKKFWIQTAPTQSWRNPSSKPSTLCQRGTRADCIVFKSNCKKLMGRPEALKFFLHLLF